MMKCADHAFLVVAVDRKQKGSSSPAWRSCVFFFFSSPAIDVGDAEVCRSCFYSCSC